MRASGQRSRGPHPSPMHELSHCVTATCDVTAQDAVAFPADPRRLGSWALGCWEARPISADTVRGRSLLDGATSVVRVGGAPERLTVDYGIGADGEELLPRISVRVVPGPSVGRRPDQCLVTMLAWRPSDMSDERWARLVASHEGQILLLKARIEE